MITQYLSENPVHLIDTLKRHMKNFFTVTYCLFLLIFLIYIKQYVSERCLCSCVEFMWHGFHSGGATGIDSVRAARRFFHV